MAVLESPEGVQYETEDEQEIQNLTLGHGYKKVSDDEPAPASTEAAPTDTEQVDLERAEAEAE